MRNRNGHHRAHLPTAHGQILLAVITTNRSQPRAARNNFEDNSHGSPPKLPAPPVAHPMEYGLFHRVLPSWGTVSSRSVTITLMTVAGKGGRPRKWRSDADRVRAFRARQRGDEEPPALDIAFQNGDDLAVALAHNGQLQASLAQVRRSEAKLGEDLRSAQVRAEAERRRLERVLGEAAACRQEVGRLDA